MAALTQGQLRRLDAYQLRGLRRILKSLHPYVGDA